MILTVLNWRLKETLLKLWWAFNSYILHQWPGCCWLKGITAKWKYLFLFSGGVVGETIKEYKEYIPVDVLETEVKLVRLCTDLFAFGSAWFGRYREHVLIWSMITTSNLLTWKTKTSPWNRVKHWLYVNKFSGQLSIVYLLFGKYISVNYQTQLSFFPPSTQERCGECYHILFHIVRVIEPVILDSTRFVHRGEKLWWAQLFYELCKIVVLICTLFWKGKQCTYTNYCCLVTCCSDHICNFCIFLSFITFFDQWLQSGLTFPKKLSIKFFLRVLFVLPWLHPEKSSKENTLPV